MAPTGLPPIACDGNLPNNSFAEAPTGFHLHGQVLRAGLGASTEKEVVFWRPAGVVS